MARLSEAQKQALKAMPVSITMWGGKPFAGMPAGIRNRSTLWALQKMGLVAITYRGSQETWRTTEAGRLALEQSSRDGGGDV